MQSKLNFIMFFYFYNFLTKNFETIALFIPQFLQVIPILY
jgi:hypothetical protein